MTLVRHDYLPEEMTDGERAALRDASATGWIIPPVIVAWQPEPPRPWRSAHIRYLERRQLVRQRRYRIDGACCVRLNEAGMAARAAELAA